MVGRTPIDMNVRESEAEAHNVGPVPACEDDAD
jgi:hypothetical protein